MLTLTMIKEILAPVQPLLPYLVVLIALYLCIRQHFPFEDRYLLFTSDRLTGIAFLALVLAHVQC